LKFIKHKARTFKKLNNKCAISVLGLSIQKWLLTNQLSLESDWHNTEAHNNQQGTEQRSPGQQLDYGHYFPQFSGKIYLEPSSDSQSNCISPLGEMMQTFQVLFYD
jgi:hypothetical protein